MLRCRRCQSTDVTKTLISDCLFEGTWHRHTCNRCGQKHEPEVSKKPLIELFELKGKTMEKKYLSSEKFRFERLVMQLITDMIDFSVKVVSDGWIISLDENERHYLES